MRLYKWLHLIIAPAFLFLSCTENHKGEITVTNPAQLERPDELIVLKRNAIEKKTGNIPAGKFVKVIINSQPVAVQYDDLDSDGAWDELAFLYSFKPGEKINLSFSISDAPATIKAVVRAHVRQRKKNADDSFGPVITKDTMPAGNPPTDFSKVPLPPYLTEGPAWENDKVAFRLYFDTRNGKDVFGKLIPGMVMDTIGVNHNNSYHELSNWGMDILHVGKSLGAGSVAIAAKDANGKDTLMRLGGANIKSQVYKVIADGPVRAVFSIKYQWEINGKPVQITDETSIWGGQYFYETTLNISGVPADAKLVTGFADFFDNQPGQIDTAGTKIFYSYGPQSENKDDLGLAVAIHSPSFASYKRMTDTLGDIRNSYLVSQQITQGGTVTYRFYAAWGKTTTSFMSLNGFDWYLKQQAVLLAQPVLIE